MLHIYIYIYIHTYASICSFSEQTFEDGQLMFQSPAWHFPLWSDEAMMIQFLKVEVLTPMAPAQSVPIDPAQDAAVGREELDQIARTDRSDSFLEASRNIDVSRQFIFIIFPQFPFSEIFWAAAQFWKRHVLSA